MGYRLHSHSPRDNPSQIAGIALVSAMVGALTALLLAPRSGAATRQEIRVRVAAKKAAMRDRLNDQIKEVESDESGAADSSGQNLPETTVIAKHPNKDSVENTVRPARKKKTDSEDWTDDIRRNGER